MEVVLIGTDVSEEYKKNLSHALGKLKVFNSFEQVLAENTRADVFILNDPETKYSLLFLEQIRKNNRSFLTPVFSIQSLPSTVEILDGDLLHIATAQEKIQNIQTLISEIKIHQLDGKSKLLYYLFTRPDLILKPQSHWQNPTYYSYPLIEFFCADSDSDHLWLLDLINQKILKKGKLVNTVFCCFHCKSAHLQFVEICPNCKSINIELSDFLHCFNCGTVAPQQEFMQSERLICPKCNTPLRHIGDDYDRPLESGVCLDCNEYYTDNLLQVICMMCEKSYAPERLNKTYIHELMLTEKGRNYLQFNTVESDISIFDHINYIRPEFFFSTLDWLIALQNRYADQYFSLLGIYLPITELEFDREFIPSFSEYLRKNLRNTDLLTRLNERYIWILLPKTDSEGVCVIITRIQKFMKELNTPIKPDLKLVSFASSTTSLQQETALLLTAKLASQL